MERLIKRYTIFDLYDLIDTTEVCLSKDVEKLEKHFYKDDKALEKMKKLNEQMQEIINKIKAQTKKG